MKLRIAGNSVRLRLSRAEVSALAEGNTIRETTRFSVYDTFAYEVSSWELEVVEAKFEKGKLSVFIPKSKVVDWPTSAEISISGTQENDSATPLEIVVEKDFGDYRKEG